MRTPRLQSAFLFIALGLSLVLAFTLFRPFLSVIVVSAMAAVVAYPLKERISGLFRGKGNGLSSFLTLLVVFVLILTPVAFIAYQVFTEALVMYADVSSNRDAYFDTLARVVLEPLQRLVPGFVFDVDSALKQGLGIFTANFGRLFSGTVEVFADLVLFLIAFYYFLKDGPRFAHAFMALSPLHDKFDKDVFDRMSLAINSMVRGQLLVAMIQGLLTGLGFALFGIPSPALWGSLAAICALVPGVGTSLVIVPGILFLFATGQTFPGLGLLAWGGLAVGLIDNMLGPTLIGKGAKIHPLFVLFAVLGGLALYGPLGFLLGPLTVSFVFALLDIYRLLILRDRPILTEKSRITG
ncbi:AI-2E family transporter [Candidatus Uhrbacteria bacterium]|nr:AI-2E family transporter [Candidatus Uhrbacteria bacterium]